MTRHCIQQAATSIVWLAVLMCWGGLAQAETRSRVVVSADGSLVAAMNNVSAVHLYTADTLKHVGKFHAPAEAIGLSHDGAMLAAYTGQELAFHKSATGEKVAGFRTSHGAAFSDDGRWCLAPETFHTKGAKLIDMSTGKVKHRIEDVRAGVGFSADGEHFVVVRLWRKDSKAKDFKLRMARYTIEDAKAGTTVEIQTKPPNTQGDGIRPIRGGYLIERGTHFWTVQADGTTTDHGLFQPLVYSGAPGALLLAADRAYVDRKNGFHIGGGRSFAGLKSAMEAPDRLFVPRSGIPGMRENDEFLLSDLTFYQRHYYLAGEGGSVIKMDTRGKVVAIGDHKSLVNPDAFPVKAREPGGEAAVPALAEVEIRAKPKVSVEVLKPGAPRLSGKARATMKAVGEELEGAHYVRVPWHSRPEYSIKVTKGGYLYVMKGDKALIEREDLKWEKRPEAVSGPYLAGAHRITVRAGDTLSMKGWELSLVAAKISTK